MSDYILNAPIGYTKNPDFRRGYFVSDFNMPTLNLPASLPIVSRLQLCGSDLLSQLPVEIRESVVSHLDQYSCISLALTSKSWSSVCLQRLYRNIVVDTSYSEFSKEFPKYVTYINLLYSFKKLIRNYDGRWPILNFQVIHLPDSTNVYDMHVNNHLLQFFANAGHLKSLVWLSDNFKLDFLKNLPNKSSITTLAINIKFSNYLGELSLRNPPLDFTHLSHFHLRPFHNKHRLLKVLNNIIPENASELLSTLRGLKLARFDKDTSGVAPLARELHEMSLRQPQTNATRDLETDTLKVVFKVSRLKYMPARLLLTELGLNDFILDREDANLLAHSVDLHCLKKLELKSVCDSSNVDEESLGFLDTITPYLSKLASLHLDMKETTGDSCGRILARTTDLVELDWVIRSNDFKWHHVDREATFSAYADSLRSKKKLKKLLLEIRDENLFCETVVTTPLLLIDAIGSLQQLQSLRLNSGDTTLAVEEILSVLARLHALCFLDVFGAKAGGAPHLGLGSVHPNVYDEWFKVQHVALLYKQAQTNLLYARINQCVFEFVTGGVEPRDEIDGWFDKKVRVGE